MRLELAQTLIDARDKLRVVWIADEVVGDIVDATEVGELGLVADSNGAMRRFTGVKVRQAPRTVVILDLPTIGSRTAGVVIAFDFGPRVVVFAKYIFGGCVEVCDGTRSKLRMIGDHSLDQDAL